MDATLTRLIICCCLFILGFRHVHLEGNQQASIFVHVTFVDYRGEKVQLSSLCETFTLYLTFFFNMEIATLVFKEGRRFLLFTLNCIIVKIRNMRNIF